MPQSRVRAKRRRQRIIIASIVFVLLSLLLGGLVWLSYAPFLRITVINVSGEQTLDTATITTFVQNEIAGYRWYLFANNDIFLYPKTQIETDLPAQMPVIASAEVRAVNFHTIAVDIVERQPKALWCAGNLDASSTNCLLLDQSGAAYAPADLSIVGQNGGYQHYYGTLSNTTTTPQQYLPPTVFTSLSALVDTIAESQPQDSVTSVYVDENNDVHVDFASGFKLLFTLSDDGGVYSRFQLALQSDAFAGHTIADFQYLDLRFGDRLYYKLKGQ